MGLTVAGEVGKVRGGACRIEVSLSMSVVRSIVVTGTGMGADELPVRAGKRLV